MTKLEALREFSKLLIISTDCDNNLNKSKYKDLLLRCFEDFDMQTCLNCEYMVNGNCDKLKDKVWPEIDTTENDGFHLETYEVDQDFGCSLFKHKILQSSS